MFKKIDAKYVLGIYNSKLINFYYQTIVPEIEKAFPQVKAINLKELPIKIPNEIEESIIIDKVIKLLHINQELIDLQYNFRTWLDIEYSCGDISNRNKLFNFWELDEKEFFTQLKKKIGKISVKDYSVIKNEFEDIVKEIKTLMVTINNLNNQLDDIIYELYELTSEDIAIIENSFGE